MATTALIAFVAVAAWRGRGPKLSRSDTQLFGLFGVVLIANAAVSYAYTKHEIISIAGAFYAFAAYVAVRYAIHAAGSGETSEYRNGIAGPGLTWRPIVSSVLLGVLALAWTLRSAGVHHMIQVQAFRERLEWARLDPERIAERGYPSDARSRALTAQLRRDALDLRLPNPSEAPAWADDLWGE
jgi:hypothetical protein